MSQLFTSTRGIASWRERLANLDRQWKRGFSALETAAAWETASRRGKGIPAPISNLLRDSAYGEPSLLFAVAEHKVELKGEGGASQSDV